MKSGYPPKSLTIVPELPLESLGLKRGEQLIVTQKSGTSAPRPGPPSIPAQPQAPVQPREAPASLFTSGSGRTANASSGGPESVQTDAGFLVHRVSFHVTNRCSPTSYHSEYYKPMAQRVLKCMGECAPKRQCLICVVGLYYSLYELARVIAAYNKC